jgi:short-subunit dehydrogenase
VQPFQDQVVVVTGATSGIGRALARAFTAAGARVLGTGRDQARLGELAREVDLALTLDVREDRDVALLQAVVADRYGRLDVLVNCAGVGLFAPWDATGLDDLRLLLEVDLVGAVRVAQALLPGMITRGSGTLVQLASVASLRGFSRQTAYCAAKHALVGWSEALRQELRGSGVRVCVVCPPAVDTPFFARAGWPEVVREHPRWRPLSAEHVAAATLEAVARGDEELVLGSRLRLLQAATRVSPAALVRARMRR